MKLLKIKNLRAAKRLAALLIFISAAFYASFSERFNPGIKVFSVKNPAEIFADTNNNLIFDEREPVKIKNVNYINKYTDYNKYPILKQLNDEEKFFLEYKALETASDMLKNRHVKLENGAVYIDGKNYADEIISSKYAFNDDESSQKALIDNIKSINLNDCAVLNLKNRKYHTLSCPSGRKSIKYKIVKRASLKKTDAACRMCIIQEKPKEISAVKTHPEYKNKYADSIYTNENIKIFFADLNKTFKPDNSCKAEICRALKHEIDSAEKSIDTALYGINNQPEIVKALINAHKRGVKIRRVYDYSEKKYYKDNEILDKIIPDYKTDEKYSKNNRHALMHNKYFIFDEKKVWTGSSNISSTDLSEFNANYALLITSSQTASKYKEDFEQMYKGIFHKDKKPSKSEFININGRTKIKALFSPQDNAADTQIIPFINRAEKYIYISAFFITHRGMEEALINAYKRGIDVKIIIDAVNAHTKYSVHKRLRRSNLKVKTENYAGKMHSKTIIIDDKYILTGSMNFTRSGSLKNDENMLIIDDAAAAEFMRSTFMHLWNKIPDKYLHKDPPAESPESIGSCSDGIDNDFDELIDNDDNSCRI